MGSNTNVVKTQTGRAQMKHAEHYVGLFLEGKLEDIDRPQFEQALEWMEAHPDKSICGYSYDVLMGLMNGFEGDWTKKTITTEVQG